MNSDPDDARRHFSPVSTHIPQEGGLKKKKKNRKNLHISHLLMEQGLNFYLTLKKLPQTTWVYMI